MANEVSHRHSAKGETLYFTIRNVSRQMWNTAGTPNFETLTVANWGDYDVALSESPASSYFYVGTFPAISGNMVAGWYWVDVFKRAGGSPAISDVIQASYFGYWDGTTYKWWGEDTVAISGTVQTARDIGASVLLSAGTGTGQLDFSSGVVKSNLVQVIATALTETGAGYLAAGFKKFFDVASPTSTMNLITAVTTATNLTNLPAKVLKYFQLLFRKDAAIATDNATELTEINADGGSGAGAYDNTTDSQEGIRDTAPLGTAMRGTDNAALASELAKVPKSDGAVTWNATAVAQVQNGLATSTEVTAIQNNTRVVRVVPTVIERPDAGTTTYRIELLLYDAVGNMEAPDSAPTIALVNQGGTDLSARLDSTTMALVSTGRYRAVYTASSTDDLEQLVWTFSVVEGGATRLYGNTTLIVDTTAVDFTAADRSKLEAINSDWTDGGRLDLLIDAIIARIGPITGSGDNTLLGFFKAALNKAAATPTDIGGTFAPSTDSVEAIRDRGDAAWTTATGFSTLDAAGVRTALGLGSANLDTQLDALLNLLEADMFVDTTTTPWTLCIRQKGTATNLLVKSLKTVAGANITDADTAVGQEIHVP